MRSVIYNPYLDTVGGGERYTTTVAYVLKKHRWEVDVVWREPKILDWLSERLGLNLPGINVVENSSRGMGYDLAFWLSDGSIPTLFARKNILHFQTPFQNVGGRKLFNRIKLAKIQKIVCNSKFTKGFIDKEFDVRSTVVYPPVLVSKFKPGKKENLILFVGRFSQLQQQKRQGVLIEVFRQMYEEGLRDWRLVIAGGSDVGRTDFVERLKKEAEGFPIDILENLPFSEIKKFYAKSKIFWSAAGFGVDEKREPEKVEHFGIAAVEAMAAGCVPLLYSAGGHKEIVSKDAGILWKSLEELKAATLDLAGKERRRETFAKRARETAQEFSETRFEKEILKLVS